MRASKPSTGADWAMIERFALRNAFDDVEQHDVAQFLQPDEMRERAADLARADQRNLVTSHLRGVSLLDGKENEQGSGSLALSDPAFKSGSPAPAAFPQRRGEAMSSIISSWICWISASRSHWRLIR